MASKRGLTLLELLLVVFILSAIALTAVTLVDGADEQFRYQDTKTRLEIVRRAVIGDPAGGSAGFVADYGRLPRSLSELLEQGPLASWSYDGEAGSAAGWRGPYVTVLPDSDGARRFRDGWGADWQVFAADEDEGTLAVGSYGSDRAPGGTDYAADYPPSGFLVERFDHQVDVRSWEATVVFQNSSGAPQDPGTVRLRLHYPLEGSFAWPAAWPSSDAERDLAPWLSEEKPVGAVPPGGSVSVTFRFGTALAARWIPWGERSLAVVSDATGAPVPGSAPRRVVLRPRAPLPPIEDMAWVLP